MPWVYLIVAGVLEIVWAYTMKQSHGFSRLIPSIITISAMVASFWLLAFAMRTIPLGTAYPVWTGIGAVGAFLVGIAFLGESVNAARIIAAILIVSGLVLMKLASPISP
ncbi:MAG: quaternary ammonium compound efflux SMR transporter SugE [Porticoccaceae bacterium]|nr:quaternary ammonium compound efflux SMR transporter SugE [Porticoccaceae bacterium]